MNILRQVSDGFARWIDAITVTILTLLGSITTRRDGAQLVEVGNGVFALEAKASEAAVDRGERVQIFDGRVVGTVPAGIASALRGSRVELILKPERFMFRPLELPGRAAEFIDGIVRSQIDRLTPWSPGEAVFGWTKPTQAGPERIVVTVAATARALVTPFVQALANAGAASVAVSTLSQNSPLPIRVFDESSHGALDARRIRRALVAVILVSAVTAAAGIGAASAFASRLGHRQDELARRIAERRSAMLGGRENSLDAATAAQRTLERRKHESPVAVLVLEALSQILPDHTYVTELRIEGDKLRVIGLTKDAPSLIGLMEQTSQFTRATFFAPTTRSPNEAGERFHIEARIEPLSAPRS